MSKGDLFQHNPWRYPGNAPVFDSCGVAGGGPKWIPTQLSFIDTVYAKQGDLGSKVLPPAPTGVVWHAGSNVNATWTIRANHGGGYQYRLCPSKAVLNEECFRALPLPFTEEMVLMWGDGSTMAIKGTYLREGTVPAGSVWAMNPLPYSDNGTAVSFPPPCEETVSRHANDTGKCSGRFPYATSIIDTLTVPVGTAPGPYVLQLRYDCEATAQIWTNCADIEIA